jgi:hypothetical protein
MVLLIAAILGLAWFSTVLFVLAICRAASTEQPLVGVWSRFRRRRAVGPSGPQQVVPIGLPGPGPPQSDFPAGAEARLHG